MNFQSLRKMRDGAVIGIDFNDDDSDIRRCETCAYGKLTTSPFKDSSSKSSDILELIHSDLMEPMENMSIGHARYILSFIDDYSRKIFIYFLKEKSEVMSTFIDFKVFIENQTGKKIKVLRTDNGTEYCSSEFKRLYRKNGIKHQTTCTYTPEQNGLAEHQSNNNGKSKMFAVRCGTSEMLLG